MTCTELASADVRVSALACSWAWGGRPARHRLSGSERPSLLLSVLPGYMGASFVQFLMWISSATTRSPQSKRHRPSNLLGQRLSSRWLWTGSCPNALGPTTRPALGSGFGDTTLFVRIRCSCAYSKLALFARCRNAMVCFQPVVISSFSRFPI